MTDKTLALEKITGTSGIVDIKKHKIDITDKEGKIVGQHDMRFSCGKCNKTVDAKDCIEKEEQLKCPVCGKYQAEPRKRPKLGEVSTEHEHVDYNYYYRVTYSCPDCLTVVAGADV